MNGIVKQTEVNSHAIEETFMHVWTEKITYASCRTSPASGRSWASTFALFARLHSSKKVDPAPVSAMSTDEKSCATSG